MIRLKADTVLVRHGDVTSPLDLDGLCESLQRSCRAAGFDDPALAHDVMQIIRHHLCSASSDVMTAFAVESLVCRILSDAGLRSVARQFRGVLADRPDDITVAVNPDAVADILRADSYFAGLPVALLSDQVAEAARHIGMERMTYGCCAEMAKSLWLQELGGEESDDAWVMSDVEVATITAAAMKDSALINAATWSGVSRLVPVVTVRFSVGALITDSSVAELELFPLLDRLCRDALSACSVVRDEAAVRLLERAPDTIRAVVLLDFSGGMMQQKLKLSTKGLYSLRTDVESICRHHFDSISWIRADVI
jgi:hypothetical protein